MPLSLRGKEGREVGRSLTSGKREVSMPFPLEAILISGTSHVGKSTLAERLAGRLGWAGLSTDGTPPAEAVCRGVCTRGKSMPYGMR